MKFAGSVPACNPAIRSCCMRRALTRVLIWLRWPTAVLEVLVLALTLMSYFGTPRAWCRLWDFDTDLGLYFGNLHAIVCLRPDPSSWPIYFHGKLDDRAMKFAWFEGWWDFRHVVGLLATSRIDIFVFPTWCLFLPLGAFSWAGFHAKRRMPAPVGLCPRCRHPLAGAAVCPECGTRAQAG